MGGAANEGRDEEEGGGGRRRGPEGNECLHPPLVGEPVLALAMTGALPPLLPPPPCPSFPLVGRPHANAVLTGIAGPSAAVRACG